MFVVREAGVLPVQPEAVETARQTEEVHRYGVQIPASRKDAHQFAGGEHFLEPACPAGEGARIRNLGIGGGWTDPTTPVRGL